MKRILITGPESTGKSELSLELASQFGGISIPEFARGYIENLDRPYSYSDVEHIAKKQSEEYDHVNQETNWIFFDTWLVITKVWFEVVYKKTPGWIEDRIRQASFDLVLLCDTDLPWIPDPVRENGGVNREKLLDIYKNELDRFGMDWTLISGSGSDRVSRANRLINNKINYGTR